MYFNHIYHYKMVEKKVTKG